MAELKKEFTTKMLLEKIPAEKCWEITAKVLLIFMTFAGIERIEVLTGKDEEVIAPVLAWDKYWEIHEKIFGDGGRQMFLWAKETFNIPVENAIDAAKLVTVAGALMQGPEYKTELVEATPEKVILRTINCVLWDIEKEYGSDPELWIPSCVKVSQIWGEKGLKAINPQIHYTMTKSLEQGEPYCEAIIEFKDK